MMNEATLRTTLWLTVPFNFFAAGLLAMPDSAAGQLAGLPSGVPPIYAWVTGFLVFSYGVLYIWMAQQSPVPRPVLAITAAGKTCVFVLAALLWSLGEGPGRLVLLASGDLAFAAYWSAYLAATRA